MATPYYQDGYVTIYHGDCREVLPTFPDSSVDIVMTDPPYGMSYKSGRYKAGNPWGEIECDHMYPKEVFTQGFRVARCAMLAFCRWDNLMDMPRPDSFIVWEKNNCSAGDLEHAYGRQWEAIAFWAFAGHRWANGRPRDIVKYSRVPSESLQHPTEKPIGLLKELMRHHEWDTVIDPFMGSGTVIRAARELGRKSIGIELDERYCETAARRLDQGVLIVA